MTNAWQPARHEESCVLGARAKAHWEHLTVGSPYHGGEDRLAPCGHRQVRGDPPPRVNASTVTELTISLKQRRPPSSYLQTPAFHVSFSYVYRKPSTELPVARFMGLLSEVEECCISAGNTSLDCQNIYSKVWFPGAMGGMAIVCLLRDSGAGASKALDPSLPQKPLS